MNITLTDISAGNNIISRIDNTQFHISSTQPFIPIITEEQITGGVRLLADLPIDVIPQYHSLPIMSRLHFRQNAIFVGRKAELLTIAKIVKEQNSIIAICGIGGLGKSQIAIEFVHRYGQYFSGGIFWLNASTYETVISEIASCHGVINQEYLPLFLTLTLEQRSRIVKSCWESELPRLIIFDALEDEEILRHILPSHGNSRIIFTTRKSRWPEQLGITIINISGLTTDESINLLRKFQINHEKIADLTQIATKLANLPLALTLAGSYLARYRHKLSAREYLHQINNSPISQHPSMLQDGKLLIDYNKSNLELAFGISYENLDTNNPIESTAIKVLYHCSLLAPSIPIPIKFLELSLLNRVEENFSSEKWDVLRNLFSNKLISKFKPFDTSHYHDSIIKLLDLGLIQELEIDNSIIIHPLISDFIRSKSTDKIAQLALGRASLITISNANKNIDFPTALPLIPHILSIADRTKLKSDLLTITIFHELGLFLHYCGYFEFATKYLKQAVDLVRKVPPHSQIQSTSILINLALSLQTQGKFEEAIKIIEEVLEIQKEERLKGASESLAFVRVCAASILLDLDKVDEAFSYLVQAYNIIKSINANNNQLEIDILRYMGDIYERKGDFQESKKQYEEALNLNKGENKNALLLRASTLNSLGSLVYKLGDIEASLKHHLEALNLRIKILGKEHPDVANCQNNMGRAYAALGNYDTALECYEQAMRIYRRTLAPPHPAIATTLINMSAIYARKKQFVLAIEVAEEALAMDEAVYGSIHSEVAMDLEILASYHLLTANRELANKIAERTQKIRQQIVGDNHIENGRLALTLAELYAHENRFTEALNEIDKALEIFRLSGANEQITQMPELRRIELIGLQHGEKVLPFQGLPVDIYQIQAQHDLVDEIEDSDYDPLVKSVKIQYEHAKRKWKGFSLSESYLAFCRWVREQFSTSGRGCVYITHEGFGYMTFNESPSLPPEEIILLIQSYDPENEVVVVIEVSADNENFLNYGKKPLF